MVTLAQAKKLPFGETLFQIDVDAVNDIVKFTDNEKIDLLKSWASQYHFDGIAEGKQADKENWYAYGD